MRISDWQVTDMDELFKYHGHRTKNEWLPHHHRRDPFRVAKLRLATSDGFHSKMGRVELAAATAAEFVSIYPH